MLLCNVAPGTAGRRGLSKFRRARRRHGRGRARGGSKGGYGPIWVGFGSRGGRQRGVQRRPAAAGTASAGGLGAVGERLVRRGWLAAPPFYSRPPALGKRDGPPSAAPTRGRQLARRAARQRSRRGADAARAGAGPEVPRRARASVGARLGTERLGARDGFYGAYGAVHCGSARATSRRASAAEQCS
jgi:hypothetical protein